MTFTIAVCTVKKKLMMDRGTVRNMQSFIPKINLRSQCIQLILLYKFITMHGPLNVRFAKYLLNVRSACQSHSFIQDVRSWKSIDSILEFVLTFPQFFVRIDALYYSSKKTVATVFRLCTGFCNTSQAQSSLQFLYITVVYLHSLFCFILPFHFVLFAWFLVGKEVKKMKDAKRYAGLLYLNDLYSSPNIVRVIKSRRIRWDGHVTRMGEERGVCRVLVGKPEGK